MARDSKRAKLPYKNEAAALFKEGFTHNAISKWYRDRNVEVDARTIGRLLHQDMGIPERNDKKAPYNKTAQSEHTKTDDEIKPDLVVVDLKEIFDRFEISNDLSKIENIVEATQKMTAQIFLLEAGILYKKLEAHATRGHRHPNEQFKGYKVASEVMKSAWGYEQNVNLSQAMKTLEGEGYQITGMKYIEEYENGSSGS